MKEDRPYQAEAQDKVMAHWQSGARGVRGVEGADGEAVKVSPMPLPWCDRCDKSVDLLEQYEDVFSQQLVFTAVCHGERERVVVDLYDLIGSKVSGVSMGKAFVRARRLGS